MELPLIYKQEISEYSDKEFGECVYKKKSRLEKELETVTSDIKKAERAIQNRWVLDVETCPELFSEEEILQMKRVLGLFRIETITYSNGTNDVYIGYDKLNKKFRVSDNKSNIKPSPAIDFGFGFAESDGFSVEGTFGEIINNETIKKEIKNLVKFYEELRTITEKYKEY